MAIPRYELDCLLFTGIDPKGKALRFCIPFEELQSKRTIYIGRSGVCAIRFDREYKEVSRLHARIRCWDLDDIYICNESEYTSMVSPCTINGCSRMEMN